MKNLSHKSSINIPHWALGLLLLLFFCAPAYASDAPATPTFRSTSPFGINQTIQGTTVNINGIHSGTIYKPFSSDHPYADLNPGSGSGNGNNDDDDDIGIGGWVDTPSEPLPIGDTLPLFLFATAMIAIISIKQRKQQRLTTQTQSTNKNDNTQHMTTRKQTYQSVFQKLFLLLAFVCIAGQVSADKTIYFRPSTTAFRYGYTDPDNTGTTWDAVYWTKGVDNYFPIELRTTKTNTYSSQWTTWSNLTWARDILSGDKTRFIPITVPNNYKYIVVYRCVNQKNKTVNETNYNSWKNSTNKGKEDTNIKNQNTIPKLVSNGQPSEPELIPTDGKNLLCNREGWWDVWYWAYYIPKNSDVRAYFANLYDWPNLQLLFGKDIYSIASWSFEHIENTKLYQRTLNYSDFEVGYEQYGFISNPDDKKFSPSHQIHPYQHNCVGSNDGTEGNMKYMTGWVDSDSYSKNNENTTAKANRIANRIKTANKYTALQANLLSGSELFIPESGENGTAASKSHLTNGWQDLNHTVTVKSYVYNLETKSFDINSNEGGYITYYTHQLTGAKTATRVPASGTNTIDAASGSGTFTAAYTAETELTAIPKPGYRFAGWYDDAGTLVYSDAHHPHHAVRNEDYTIHARFVANDVKCFKYRVQTCESEKEFNTKDFSAKGGTIYITATDGQLLTISEAIGNDQSYQYLYHHNDVTITGTAESNDGYVFIGWWNNDNGQIVSNPWKEKAGNMDDYVTARFASVDNVTTQTINVSGSGSATITRYLDHASSQSVTTTQSVTVNAWKGTSVTLVAEADQGHTFVGWYEGQNLVSKELTYTYPATEARNITAYFAEGTGTTTLTVRAMIYKGTELVRSLEGGTFTMTHSGGIVYKPINKEDKDVPVLNTPVTFAAEANDGYEFIAWFNNKKGQFLDNPWIMQNPGNSNTYDKTVTAVFASNEDYAKKQDIKIEGPGTVTANYTFYKDDDKQALTKTTTFHHNSSFVAWSGHNVTLTAEALAGYEFDGWYENGSKQSENSTYSYDATTTRTITAKFVSEVNKLTVSVLNYNTSYNEFREYEYEYNTITLTGGDKTLESYSSFSCEFKDATNVTLTATPEDGEDGYDFIGWYQNGTKISTEKTINVNVIGMQAISAHFAPKKCFNVRLLSPKGGTYSVKYARESLFNQEGMCYVVHTPYDKEINIYVPYDAKIAVINPKPINGYEYLGFKVFHGNNNNDGTFSIIPPSGKDKYEEVDLPAVIPNFVRTEEQVVYLDISNKDKDSDWADVTTFQCNKRNPANNIVNEKVPFTEKVDEFANIYKITIKENTYDNIDIIGNNNTKEHTTGRLAIPSTRYNCFKLNAYQSSTGEWVDAWTTLPTLEGDYRLIYREQTVVSKNEIHIDYEFNEGDRIKNINFDNQTATTQTDIVSLHIYNKVYKVSDDETINGVNNPEVILQQWNGSEWADIERYMVFGPLRSDKPGVIKMPGRRNAGATINYDNGIDAIKNDKQDNGSGVWNFVIQQTKDNEGKVTAKLLVAQTQRYEGDYYIRTTNADGQYNNYIHPGNVMKFSEYAAANSDYSHYFIRNVDINEDGTPTAEAGKHPQVKFTVATAYTEFLCKELMINNNRFSEDEYENDIFVINDNNNPKLPADASVRFGWDSKTNRLTRAYIANTTIKNNEYLVVEGEEGNNKIGSPSGDAVYFTDNSNWLYSIDLPDAQAGATAKVKAKMNGQYQYFMGSESEYETLISGNGANTYPIRLLYDFKDDRFTTIYRPTGTINNDVTLSTPLMIEREHNEPATQIQLETNKKITTVQAGEDQYTQPAYAVMTFLESVLADASKTHHEKMFYWISFPFDVCIRDVFGLGDYGKYWIMEEYNGAQRAASGLAQNNWKYITKKSHILKKDTGYVLCLNYSQILQDQLFKSYGGSDKTLNSGKLSLYFPSNSAISPAAITGGQTREVTLAQYENANTAWNHHNWHIIGVPSFANPEFVDFQDDIPFVYEYWHPGDAYAAVSINDVEFHAMHAYMVQYHGTINWESIVNTSDGNVQPKALAAKTDEQADKKVMLRLELQQAGSPLDKTYVQLRNDKGTKGFDMSLDLTKIINAGANIYSIVDNHEMAGNAIPKEETVLPLGVVITAAGEYTFAMPNGTEGMIVELIDYEQGTSTNLLMSDYTITLNKGTFNQRFALRLVPDKVATSVDNIGNGENGDEVRKLFIDGVLYLVKDGAVYDAQGHAIR